MAKRLKAMGNHKYRNGFKFTFHEPVLEEPLNLKNPTTIFVNSMSDTFHEQAPEKVIIQLFDLMAKAPWHTFQVLTKRSERLATIASSIRWSKNIWMGVTIESGDYLHRADHLRTTNAAVKYLSLEPLLGPLSSLNLDGIDWVIVGGESGPKARPMDKDWVIEIREKCLEQSVPFFFKQWGGTNKKKAGRMLDNRTWDEFPETTVIDS
jgi:protein gp37